MIPPLGAPLASCTPAVTAWRLQTKTDGWASWQADVFELKGAPRPAAASRSAIPLDLDESAMALNNTLSFIHLAWLKDCISVGGALLVAYFGSWRGYQGFCQQTARQQRCTNHLQALADCCKPPIATPRSFQRNQQATQAFYTQQHNAAQLERRLNLLAFLGTSCMSLAMLGSLQSLATWAYTSLVVNVLLGVGVPLVAAFGLLTAYLQWRTLQHLVALQHAAQAVHETPARQLLLHYLQRHGALSRLKGVAALTVGLGAPLCLLFSSWWLLLMLPGTFTLMWLAPHLDALAPGMPPVAHCAAAGSKTCLQQQILLSQAFLAKAHSLAAPHASATAKQTLRQLWQHYWQTRHHLETQQAQACSAKLARAGTSLDSARWAAHQRRWQANNPERAVPIFNLNNFLEQFDLWPLFIYRVINDATLRRMLLPTALQTQHIEQAQLCQRCSELPEETLLTLWNLAYATLHSDLLPAQLAQQNAWLQLLGERWRLQAI